MQPGNCGCLWFTEAAANNIATVPEGSPNNFAEIGVPTAASEPLGITQTLDGTIWFTEFSAGKIGRYDVNTSTFTEYALGSGHSPAFITEGRDGNAWFTDVAGNAVGTITGSGAVTEYAIPTANAEPWRIDPSLYFTELLGNKIGFVRYR